MKQKELCPVALLAREARRLEAKCIDADERGDRFESNKAEKRLNAIRAAAPNLQPKSIVGAQYLLDLINLYGNSMMDDDARGDKIGAIELMTGAISKFLAKQEREVTQ